MRPPGVPTGELVALAREGRMAAFIDRAWRLPAADLGDVFAALPDDECQRLIGALPPRLAAPALVEMPPSSRPELTLARLDTEHGARLIAELEDDDAADLLRRLGGGQRQRILASLGNPAALGQLLGYAETSAGALMTSRLVTVNELDPVGLAVEAVRRQAAAIGDLTEIFVIDSARRLTGVLSLRQILLASPAAVVRDVMAPAPIRVGPEEDQQSIARVIARYNLSSVAVVDGIGHLLGRVTADDVRDVTVNDVIEDLLRFGGVSPREAPRVAWSVAVRSRVPSLYANLFTAFAAAAVVYFFQGAIVRVVALAVWMPVVAGVGGNAGTQALATSVRRLMFSPVQAARLYRVIAREAIIGAANGVAIGVVVATVAVLLGESWKLGLVVMIAMIGNVVLAGIAGAAIPELLKRAGRDPALASPLFVTAVTDVFGFALLLGLASMILL